MAALRKIGARPKTLAEVAHRTHAGESFDPLVREFLDTFYLSGDVNREEHLRIAPESVGRIHDAYLAAVAEHLALRHQLRAPDWAEAPHRFLHEPYFAGGLESLKAILLAESPLAFRRRGLFVTKDALSRTRDPMLRASNDVPAPTS